MNVENVSPTFTILEVNRFAFDLGNQPAFFSVDVIREGNRTLVRLREGKPSYGKNENISAKVKTLLLQM